MPDRAKIRAARLARGWSRPELARRAGLSDGHVGNLESGRQQRRIKLGTAQRLAAALDTTVAALTAEQADD